jgi:hypothetical protein
VAGSEQTGLRSSKAVPKQPILLQGEVIEALAQRTENLEPCLNFVVRLEPFPGCGVECLNALYKLLVDLSSRAVRKPYRSHQKEEAS